MRLLTDLNVQVLEQLVTTLHLLDDSLWTRPAPTTNGLHIGPHVRHVIEFYECFFDGFACAEIDYDARRRSAALANSRIAAVRALHTVVARLQSPALADAEATLAVRDGSAKMRSTAGRELNCLFNHTVHHMALIAVALHAFGVPVDPTFGVAPSTLRYRQRSGVAA